MVKPKNHKMIPRKTHARRHIERPVQDDHIREKAGIAGTKGKLLKALMAEKAKERES